MNESPVTSPKPEAGQPLAPTAGSADWARIESARAEIGDEFQLGGKMVAVNGQALNHWEWLPIQDEQQRNGVRYYQLPCRTLRNPPNAPLQASGADDARKTK